MRKAPSVYSVSSTMMPVTNCGAPSCTVVRQRITTVSHVCHRLRISKGMGGCEPWPTLKESRLSKVASPSWETSVWSMVAADAGKDGGHVRRRGRCSPS